MFQVHAFLAFHNRGGIGREGSEKDKKLHSKNTPPQKKSTACSHVTAESLDGFVGGDPYDCHRRVPINSPGLRWVATP